MTRSSLESGKRRISRGFKPAFVGVDSFANLKSLVLLKGRPASSVAADWSKQVDSSPRPSTWLIQNGNDLIKSVFTVASSHCQLDGGGQMQKWVRCLDQVDG